MKGQRDINKEKKRARRSIANYHKLVHEKTSFNREWCLMLVQFFKRLQIY
jgi:hypothetical protein